MKTELTPDNLEDFQKRFGTFHDAVIHTVEYGMFGTKKPELVTIKIGTQDLQIQVKDRWVNLAFYLVGINEIIVRKSEDYTLGVIFRLNIEFFDNEVYLGLGHREEMSITPKSYSIGSDLQVTSKHLYWSVEPYQERDDISFA